MLKQLVLLVLKIYQTTTWVRSPCCRFYPSCSNYAAGSIEQHGLWAGLLLAVLRVCRCHPFNPGGVDEVPLRREVQMRSGAKDSEEESAAERCRVTAKRRRVVIRDRVAQSAERI